MHRNVKYKNGTNFNSGLTLMGLFRNWALENTRAANNGQQVAGHDDWPNIF